MFIDRLSMKPATRRTMLTSLVFQRGSFETTKVRAVGLVEKTSAGVILVLVRQQPFNSILTEDSLSARALSGKPPRVTRVCVGRGTSCSCGNHFIGSSSGCQLSCLPTREMEVGCMWDAVTPCQVADTLCFGDDLAHSNSNQ